MGRVLRPSAQTPVCGLSSSQTPRGEGWPGPGAWQGLLLSSLEVWPPRPPVWHAPLEERVMGCGLRVGLGWPGPCGRQCPSRGLDGKAQEVLSSLAGHCRS